MSTRCLAALFFFAVLALAASFAPLAEAANATVLLYRHSTLDKVPSRAARNVAYYGIFELGSPPVRYTGCFDTGSADTWVPAAACTNPACMTHSRFEPRASSTYQTLNAPFQITYGTGSVAGFVGSDLLTLGGPSNGAASASNQLRVVNQGFGIVFDSSMDFLSASCDGLFGLAFPELSEMQVNPAFFNMMRQGNLDADVFGLWLSPSPTAEPAGALTFGALDQQHYQGPITWIPVTEKAYWTVPLGGASVGFAGAAGAGTRRTVQLAAKAAIMDSGTTAILMSDADSARLHAAVPGLAYNGAGGYYAVAGGCDAVASLPDITFILGGRPYAVPARLWTQQIPKPGSSNGGVACISGIIPGGDANSIILGDNFLRAWYTAYRYDKSAHTAFVGLAKPTDIKLSLPGDEGGAGGAGSAAVKAVSAASSAAASSSSSSRAKATGSDDAELEAAVDADDSDAPSTKAKSGGATKKDPIRIGPLAFSPPRGMRGGMGGGRAAPRAEGVGLLESRSAAAAATAGGKAPAAVRPSSAAASSLSSLASSTSIGAEAVKTTSPSVPSGAGGDGMSATSFGVETGR